MYLLPPLKLHQVGYCLLTDWFLFCSQKKKAASQSPLTFSENLEAIKELDLCFLAWFLCLLFF